MKKEQFLSELGARLANLPYADKKRALDYYSEMIDDRTEDGISEDEAIRRIGTPAAAAEKILTSMPITTLARARVGSRHSAYSITTTILASPIWISLLAVAFSLIVSIFAILFALWATIFTLFVSLWATELSVAIGAIAGLIAAPLAMILYGKILLGILLLGAALVLAALAIFGYYGAIYATKGLLFLAGCVTKLYGLSLKLIKFCLIRKDSIR